MYSLSRSQEAFRHASFSPARRVYQENDTEPLRDQYKHRRDVSFESNANKTHYFSTSDTPYCNGKKNKTFDNPSLRSSNIFYEHNYGYGNVDMPNDRLLSPVKYDRHGARTIATEVGTPARNTINKPPLTPNKVAKNVEEDDFKAKAKEIQPRRLRDSFDEGEKKERRNSYMDNNNNVAPASGRRGSKREEVPSQRGSIRSQGRFDIPPLNTEEVGAHGDHSRHAKHDSHRGYQWSPKYQKRDSLDDNKSACSGNTVISTLSCNDYMCPKCLNSGMAADKRAQSAIERCRDKQMQDKVLAHNAKLSALENQREWKRRQERCNDATHQRDEINRKYYEKLENRRSPSRERTEEFKQIFDKQDEAYQRSKINSQYYRSDLKDQMRYNDEEKRYQKELDQRATGVSLELTEDYYFKKNKEPKEHVLAVLKDQVQDKRRRNMEEKEYDIQDARCRIEAARHEQMEEDRRVGEKNARQKRELMNSFYRDQDEKNYKKEENEMRKQAERQMIDGQYSAYKRREFEHNQKIKKQCRDFLASYNHEKPSYKKMYEERKLQKTATSFDNKKRPKKVYPCGQCNNLFEKVHLTKQI